VHQRAPQTQQPLKLEATAVETHEYPLVMTNIAIENGIFWGEKSTISMAMFNSYAKLPEGILFDNRCCW